MAFVTYWTARPAGLAAASTVRRIATVHETQALANARAAAAGRVLIDNVDSPAETAYVGAVSDDADPGWWLVASGAGAGAATATPPADALPAGGAELAAWRRRLHAAWRLYCDSAGHPATARQGWWSRIAGSDQALVATDRWAYSQIALGDVIASGGVAALGTAVLREAAVAHVETAISTLGRFWYGVMAGNATKRGEWAGGSVAAGARLYTDLFSSVYAIRTADGTWTQLGARMPAGFQPDTEILR